MRKLVLTETQYGRLKNLIIESEIIKSFLNEEKSYGVSSVGGGIGYTQKYDQKIKSDNGKELKIPKDTGYAPKKDNSGASFRVGNSYGWFDCKTKNFVLDNVRYKNQVLADHISKSLCKTTDAVNTSNVGNTASVSASGKSSPTQIPQEFDLYI